MKKNRPSQDDYFMSMALLAASRANCFKRAVGCVLVDSKYRVLSTGYNGVARGVPHCTKDNCPRVNITGANLSKCSAIHAEANALLFCRDIDAIRYCYVTNSPCLVCMSMLMQTGCLEIIYNELYPGSEQAIEQWETSGRSIRAYSTTLIPNKI